MAAVSDALWRATARGGGVLVRCVRTRLRGGPVVYMFFFLMLFTVLDFLFHGDCFKAKWRTL